jgi:hypothetical protein
MGLHCLCHAQHLINLTGDADQVSARYTPSVSFFVCFCSALLCFTLCTHLIHVSLPLILPLPSPCTLHPSVCSAWFLTFDRVNISASLLILQANISQRVNWPSEMPDSIFCSPLMSIQSTSTYNQMIIV